MKEQEKAKKDKMRKDEEEEKQKQLLKAKESSKMPVNRHQYIGFLRGVNANEKIRKEEDKSSKEQRLNLKKSKQNKMKSTWVTPMEPKDLGRSHS